MWREEKKFPILLHPLTRIAFPLDPQGENCLGCSLAGRVVLYATGIEREHARLSYGPQGWEILVKGVSGIRLHGKAYLPSFSPVPLRPGEVLEIGGIPLLLTEVSQLEMAEPMGEAGVLAGGKESGQCPVAPATVKSAEPGGEEMIRWKPLKMGTTQERVATETLRLKPTPTSISPFVLRRVPILGMILLFFLLLTYLLVTGKLRSLRSFWQESSPVVAQPDASTPWVLPIPVVEFPSTEIVVDWRPCGAIVIARFPSSPDIEAAQDKAIEFFRRGRYAQAHAHYAAFVLRRFPDLSLQPAAFQNVVKYNSWLYRWYYALQTEDGDLTDLQKEIEVVCRWAEQCLDHEPTRRQFVTLRRLLLEEIARRQKNTQHDS